ncbi:MAG: hypothetical protein ACPIDR_06545, partial [Candidatus Puniceispirillaceae bacterium]
ENNFPAFGWLHATFCWRDSYRSFKASEKFHSLSINSIIARPADGLKFRPIRHTHNCQEQMARHPVISCLFQMPVHMA